MIIYRPQSVGKCLICGEIVPKTIITTRRSRVANFGLISQYTCKRCDHIQHKIFGHRERTLARQLPYDFQTHDWLYALSYWRGRCPICGCDHDLSLDHWLPLCSPYSTGTTPANILPLCQTCNNEKGGSNPVEWLISKVGVKEARVKLSSIAAFFRTTRQLPIHHLHTIQ